MYGLLETGIGLWALLTPALFTAAMPIYKFIWLHTHASLLPFSLLLPLCTPRDDAANEADILLNGETEASAKDGKQMTS